MKNISKNRFFFINSSIPSDPVNAYGMNPMNNHQTAPTNGMYNMNFGNQMMNAQLAGKFSNFDHHRFNGKNLIFFFQFENRCK